VLEPRLKAFLDSVLIGWISPDGYLAGQNDSLRALLVGGRRSEEVEADAQQCLTWSCVALPISDSRWLLRVPGAAEIEVNATESKFDLPQCRGTLFIGTLNKQLNDVIDGFHPGAIIQDLAAVGLLFYIHDEHGTLLWFKSTRKLPNAWPKKVDPAAPRNIFEFVCNLQDEQVRAAIGWRLWLNPFILHLLQDPGLKYDEQCRKCSRSQLGRQVSCNIDTITAEISVYSLRPCGGYGDNRITIGLAAAVGDTDLNNRAARYGQLLASKTPIYRYYPYYRLDKQGVSCAFSSSRLIREELNWPWPDFKLSFANDSLIDLIVNSRNLQRTDENRDLVREELGRTSIVSLFTEPCHAAIWRRAHVRVKPIAPLTASATAMPGIPPPNAYLAVLRGGGSEDSRLVRLHVFPSLIHGATSYCEGTISDLTLSLKQMMNNLASKTILGKLRDLMSRQNELEVLYLALEFLHSWLGAVVSAFYVPYIETSRDESGGCKTGLYLRFSVGEGSSLAKDVSGAPELAGFVSADRVPACWAGTSSRRTWWMREGGASGSPPGQSMGVYLVVPPPVAWRQLRRGQGVPVGADLAEYLPTGVFYFRLPGVPESVLRGREKEEVDYFEADENRGGDLDLPEAEREALALERSLVYARILREAKLESLSSFAESVAELAEQTRARYAEMCQERLASLLNRGLSLPDLAPELLAEVCHAMRCDGGAIYLREGAVYVSQADLNLSWKPSAEYRRLNPMKPESSQLLLERALALNRDMFETKPNLLGLKGLTEVRTSWTPLGSASNIKLDYRKCDPPAPPFSAAAIVISSQQGGQAAIGVLGLLNKRLWKPGMAEKDVRAGPLARLPEAPFSSADIIIARRLSAAIRPLFEIARSKYETRRGFKVISHDFSNTVSSVRDKALSILDSFSLYSNPKKEIRSTGIDLLLTYRYMSSLVANARVMQLKEDALSGRRGRGQEKHDIDIIDTLFQATPFCIRTQTTKAIDWLKPYLAMQYRVAINAMVSPNLAKDAHMEPELLNDDVFISQRMYSTIVHNLLTNAVKYRKKHPDTKQVEFSVLVSLTESVHGMPGVWYKIDFTDAGAGISEKEKSVIFGEGVRGSASAGEPGGMGYGLWICKSILSYYGGSILVTSNSQPTTISVFMPRGISEKDMAIEIIASSIDMMIGGRQ
jgi:signal transduction histidine kinase